MCFIHMYLVAAAVCFIGSVHSSLTKFQCSDSRCFSSTYLCDGIPDCDDQSDEKHCAGCDTNMFKCQNSNCIRAMYACNGKDDCGDGSDELICGTCMFGCQDSRLVPADEVCDGFDDCGDGSDELNCGVASTAKKPPPSTSTATATPSTASSTSTATATPSTASSTVDQPSVIVEGQCNQTDGTYIHAKTTVAVHCDFRSNTFANLSVSCSRKGTEMSKSDRISYETGRQHRNPGLFYVKFQFTPVLRRDRGNYSCKATAGQSSKAISVSLLVYKVPAVTLSPSTLSLQEGDQRNFTCQVNNAPAVKTVPRSLVWCQANQVVTDQSKIVRVRDGMEILMMNSSDRAGVYKCGVINCTKTATLVITKPEVIVEGQCNQTDGTYIHGKTTVAVHCDFISNTFANLFVSCLRKGTEMSKSDRIAYETGRQRRNPRLFYAQFQFTPVLRRDRGNYSCKATAGQSAKAIAVSLLVYEIPTVTLSPSTLSLQEGDQRNFTCQVNNAPAVKTVPGSLVWCQANQVVTDQSKIVRVRDGMEILMMNSSDRAGVYKCGVINCTKTATLVITKPEVIVAGQCNQTDGTYIHGKTTVAVHCDFISNTFANLSVSCLRKGTEMSKSDRISYETGRQRRNPRLFYAQFQFTPVLRRDRGNYSCKATAGQSAKAIAVSLLVYEIPTVTLSPSTLSLQEGDQRNFTCQVNNAPAVKTVPGSLVWCQADQVVTDQSKIVRVRDGMEILMMNSSDRAGVYKCGVINCTKTATLVIIKPEVIVEGQCNQTDGTYIHGKTTVAVHCDFRSNTFANLSVSCLRKGTEMSKSDRISYETGRQRRNPRLFYAQFQFTPVLRRDRGNYSCKATAGQSAKAIAVSLLVYEIPTVTLSPSTLSLQEGDQRNFTCQVNNAPAVKTVPGSLVWCQADQVVTDQSKIVRVRDGMEILMMNSSDRAGVYKCGVINCTKTATLVIIKPEDKACTETTDTRGTVWPQTVSNTTMVLPCPGGFLGKVHRVCDVTGEWGEPNYINCVREEIAQIEEEVAAITEGTVSIEAVKNVLENLQKATENNDSSAGDLDKSIDIVDNIVAAVSGAASSVAVDTASVKSFVNVIDNILSVDTSKQDWQQVQKKNSTKAASLARSVTAFGLAAAESQTVNEPLKLNSSTMVMEIAKVTGRDIAFPSQGMEEVKSSLRLSKENFNNTAKITYVAASYKTMAEFLLTNTSGEETSTKEVNSQILSLAVNIGGKKLSNLKMKIYLDFHHLQGNYSESECGYWDFDKSRWLTDGCTGKDVNSSYTSCECNHLTNFAILMSPGRHVSAKHLHHLKIISIVGCSLSILGCVVTVLTHALLWSHVRSSKTIILMNLCVALTLAYSVFLAGVERTENKAVCTSVAAMLHYFFLAVFSLMLAQGIDIAVQVAVVFRKSSRLGLVLPLAWGVPAVIVGISLGITKLEGYGNDQFCWLTVTDGILFAFVGPALFVVLANAVIIAIIFRVLCSTRMMANKIKKDKIVTTVRSLCVLMPVLGVTWVFGVLAISEETVVFQYLFAVFNSLQGFLIFIMHCGLNRAIIEGIRETIARYESQITMSKSLPNSRNTDQSEERRAEKEQTCTDIPTGCNSDDLVSPTMVESTLRNVEASQKSVSNDDASPSSLIKEG